MIHLRGQGLVMTIRRIWSIKPYKSIGDFEVDYDYLEDFEEPTESESTIEPVSDPVQTFNDFDFEGIFYNLD